MRYFLVVANCVNFLVNPQTCQVWKAGVQKLIDQGVILVEKLSTAEEVSTLEIPYDQNQIPLKIPYDMTPIPTSPYPVIPLVIIVPYLFTFESTKEVPWNYDSAVYVYGQKVEDESLESKEASVNTT